MHRSRQQWLVAEWLGPSLTVRVRVRVRAREWGSSLFFLWYFPSFFFSVLKYHDNVLGKSQYNDMEVAI